LENNLHPALQRRLFWLLREHAVARGATVFVTTHSPIVVDLFADDEHAQLVHVTHDGSDATATTVLNHTSRHSVLNDLDVRASDLLQANRIIWVEGPTDRMYLNRWIELWSDGDLKEGKDYQCVFYGGRLLSHLSADESPDEQRDAIEILRVNRTVAVLIDSDKRTKHTRLNDTKKRLRDEVTQCGGIAWVTKGREVEHYLPHAALVGYLGDDASILGLYDDVLDYLNGVQKKPTRKSFDKIKLAESIIPLLTTQDLVSHLDVKTKMDALCDMIREWNRKPVPPPGQSA
jgi:hypothetical protein